MAPKRSTKNVKLTTMYNCLITGAFSDLKITCGEKTWNAHRVVVCPKSSFFRAACAGNFKEATTEVINLEDDNPLMVRFMMDYLYTDDYDLDQILPAGSPSELSIHIQMYCLGDKYDIEGLRHVSACKYRDSLEGQEATFEEYLASIPKVYLPPVSKDLQKAAIDHARLKLGKSNCSDESRSMLKRVMQGIPEFGSDLIDAVLAAPVPRMCEDCRDDDMHVERLAICHVCGVIIE
ncbi:hypothetical protein VC83_09072 [Pseudogymnoascus destructans]|uniref:BTB domain-containing protein n=2 Tax=Pseudogymnoascus destructans TaxID=655981 RepID=L8GBM5_PSED2|nr:uncharacterized protein VC83_09072 [Pseudogymnoascus destructans]ELR10048.1 hypothetical protein GMDG_04449 [Pseudogymnoascus destructans 20631-21]OAF54576.2 hypothetical protein VC83_09072 [Pseudogymnoascus destructans]